MSGKSGKDGKARPEVEIIDVTCDPKYERFLYRCIFHSKKSPTNPPYTKYKLRREYLESAIPGGFRKKVLFFKGDHVGMIEYAPAEVSGYPITGDGVIVMNCIWVHTKAQRNNFGKRLLAEVINDNKNASGFATIGLKNHWMRWVARAEMERLGFESVQSVELMHKKKLRGRRFTINLMCIPAREGAAPPAWDEEKLLKGMHFCYNHPLNHERYGCEEMEEVYER
jgi:GNAT superfamily N-acetyltransferase